MKKCIEEAQLKMFIDQLPNGLKTLLEREALNYPEVKHNELRLQEHFINSLTY